MNVHRREPLNCPYLKKITPKKEGRPSKSDNRNLLFIIFG